MELHGSSPIAPDSLPDPCGSVRIRGVVDSPPVLILGIGNVLMGDEGVGVHVVREIERIGVTAGVQCRDGGAGGFHLLGPMQEAERIVLVDATLDDQPAGTMRRLTPRFSRDYPPTLTAHDIGLKDLLDAFYLLGRAPDVTLFAISIAPLQDMGMELSAEVRARVPEIAEAVQTEARKAAVAPPW